VARGKYGWRVEFDTAFWSEKLRERSHFENVGVDERIILKWIFNK
jgi:hypothetical protein